MNNEKKDLGILALLPIAIFIIIFLGSGIMTGDFYAMPAVVAFLIALFAAFLQNRSYSFSEKLNAAAKGAGDENIITMCLIYLTAGAFSGAVTAAGGVDSTIHFALSYIPADFAVAGLFLMGCFLSLSMGTSMGTITALAPIAVGISDKTGFAAALCIGSVVCGAMFGDNLSMISDTTIAAVRTQGCEMRDKFKANFLIVTPAAIVTLLFLIILTANSHYSVPTDLTYQLIQIVPYLFVLAGALLGINVFILLISGTVLSVLIGLVTGAMEWGNIFHSIGSGVTGMYDITVISLLVACISALIRNNGGFHFILRFIKRRIKGVRGAQLGIAGLALSMDLATANNTVAIVLAGPLAKEIADAYDISKKRTASLLDIFASAGQGIIPYGAQLLAAAAFTKLTPFEIIPYLIYPILMALSAIFFILFLPEKRSKRT